MTIPKRYNETEVLQRVPDVIGDGLATVITAGTRVQLTTTPTSCMLVLITAKQTNTGFIYVGGSTIAAGRGKFLVPTGDTGWFPIDDLSKIYIDASQNNQGVEYIYVGAV